MKKKLAIMHSEEIKALRMAITILSRIQKFAKIERIEPQGSCQSDIEEQSCYLTVTRTVHTELGVCHVAAISDGHMAFNITSCSKSFRQQQKSEKTVDLKLFYRPDFTFCPKVKNSSA